MFKSDSVFTFNVSSSQESDEEKLVLLEDKKMRVFAGFVTC